MDAITTPPNEFQNVKEIHTVVVLESLFHSTTYFGYLFKFMLWSDIARRILAPRHGSAVCWVSIEYCEA